MVISKFRIVASALVAAAAILVAAPAGAAGPAWGAVKLEGAWIARVIEAPGAQWTYVSSPDASGRRATAHGSIDVGLAAGGPFVAESTTPLLIEVKMTSPTTADFNSVWYGVNRGDFGPLSGQLVYIGMNHGTMQYVAPDKAIGTHNIEFYLPAQDADHDGLPDPGQVPLFSVTVHTNETRLPLYMD
ncbi:MAG: hypothetical protein FIB04_02650 [Gammaproteobacteria bacterium]|nr:hypothetical protein [Gammaproteobacteria bacterium]